MKKTFSITTPIYYPNDIPHLGHAYTTIAADVLARWHRLQEEKIFFLTGTDEHGKKLADAAKKANTTPKKFVDTIVPEFKQAWKKLNIQYDHFIRTTDKDHEKVVQEVLQKVYDKGDIYLGEYEGLYCTACEAYYTEKDAPELQCPVHKKPLETLKEQSYFFKLSNYQEFLLKYYKDNPDFILPKKKAQEIINRVKEGLKDVSISRSSFSWGIPTPFDKKHVTFVWFDALFSYYSATQLKKSYNEFWPANIHLIGKDILWFHAVYWPAMLKAANLPLPEHIFAHGWWTVNNEKMGKSAGNAIHIEKLISIAGVDAARYFLMRETPFGDDGDFSEAMLKERYNNELANKLGNLVSRLSALAEKYGLEKGGKILNSANSVKKITEHFNRFEIDKALHEAFNWIDYCNEKVQESKTWETKNPKDLYILCNGLKDATLLVSPFLPETCERIAKTFNFDIRWNSLETPLKIAPIKKSEVLFPKIE